MQTSIHRHRPLGRDMDHPQTRSPAWEAFSRRNCTSLTDNKISAPQETDMSPSQLQNRALQNMVLPKIHWINPEGRKPNCSIRMLTSHCHSSTWYQHVTPNLILQNLFSALAASTDSVHDYPCNNTGNQKITLNQHNCITWCATSGNSQQNNSGIILEPNLAIQFHTSKESFRFQRKNMPTLCFPFISCLLYQLLCKILESTWFKCCNKWEWYVSRSVHLRTTREVCIPSWPSCI